ncbi:MAG: glutamate-5-semialdehyde dehydrogenase, partial [Pseudomonadota bacterium]|nr:glutamate-5-semialdehyde dehydrogenase [Pseudomonadota bacterium]
MPDDAATQDLLALGQRARAAQRMLAQAATGQKNDALHAMAAGLRQASAAILAANGSDIARAIAAGRRSTLVDRLTLDAPRLEAMARSLEEIASLPDPVGDTTARWTRPNGLEIARVRVPIGVIAVIFESRPNVAADAGALCMKSGNAAILRGGSDSFETAHAIVEPLRRGLEQVGLPRDAIQMLPTASRDGVGRLLEGLGGTIDLIVPRGGKSLVARVVGEARVPVLGHLEGVCHVYVHARADPAKALAICLNSKMRRPGVCGAAETILIDAGATSGLTRDIVLALIDAGCEVRGDAGVRKVDACVKAATEEDWATEYLDAVVAVRVVPGLDGAVDHVRRYGTQHTDAIVTEDPEAAERFMAEVDSAIVLHNASTQFADGGEFGFGAEIGIATGKLHARGPVGLEQLTTFKYKVRGSGQ